MNKKNTKKLFDTFPKLYAGKDLPTSENLMSFGFECGDGWFSLIWNLSCYLETKDVLAIQVKQKFGCLRFYIDGPISDEIRSATSAALNLSCCICESCGEPGELRNTGWICVACDKCHKEKK